MNLIIDIGNSRIKLFVFKLQKIVFQTAFSSEKTNVLNSVLMDYPTIDKAILSSVSSEAIDILEELQKKGITVLKLNHHTPMPISNAYKTPNTLGIDRLAVAVAAQQKATNTPSLIIDMGTAITIDLVDASGTFLGGNISPGANTRFRALNTFTKRLPLVGCEENNLHLGNDTETAIQCGVQRGIEYELRGYISDYQDIYNSLTVFITGGEAFFFAEKLKNTKFVPNLLAEGLNYILNYNIDKQYI